jgi:uncharacterized cofD-like protein
MDKSFPYNQKIVVLGGGTGQFNLLRGLVELNTPENITAVPGTWDSGGSSGRLRTELGILPPGDARRCLIGLMENEDQREIAIQLFEDRLEGFGETLQGQAVGNLIIAWLEKANGGQDKGLDAARILFGIKSKIAPVSINKLVLMAKTTKGEELVGEKVIDTRGEEEEFNPHDQVTSVFFESPAKVNPEVLEAISKADKIIFAMGSLYTSIVPHLLVPQIREAILSSQAKLYFLSNIMTELGQTDNLTTISAHVKEFIRYLGEGSRINYIVVNSNSLPENVVEIYKKEGQIPLILDEDECLNIAPNSQLLKGELATYLPNEHLLRHDPQKLAELILKN